MGRPTELTPEERADLIRRGYRPVEIWVPDTSSKAYLDEAARQAMSAVEADRKAGMIEFVDEDIAEDWDRA